MPRQLVPRLVMLTAIVAVIAGTTTTCLAGVDLSTPSGLKAGDTFRFVFVTDGGTTATSTNISDYNSFVTSQAGGATYDGTTVTWQAIGSTATVSAIANVGVNPGISGVYLANGTQVATGDGTTSGELWSGSLKNSINRDLTGTTITTSVWTGTYALTGTQDSFYALGSTFGVFEYGQSSTNSSNWVSAAAAVSGSYSLYGMSEVLTVPAISPVPEPSSLIMAAIGSTVGLALAWSRKRKEPRRQGPIGTADESK